ncbi:MAG: hypothetical protein IPH35_27850 [Rhodoferax sp.]|nr:hypothetical protein [Rhodoferax sp.]
MKSQYARSLIEASPDPLVTISPEGKITDVNEASVVATVMRAFDFPTALITLRAAAETLFTVSSS